MIGRMLRLTETRGSRSQPASAQASRYSRICSACRSPNGTPVSSVSSVELIRFMPCSAVQTAVARVPEPHQMRSGRPGDCGSIAERLRSTPVICGFDIGDAGTGDGRAEHLGVRAGQVRVRLALGGHVAERLVAVQRRLG